MLALIDARRIGVGHPEFRRLLGGELESFVTELESTSPSGPHSWYEATVSLVRDDVGDPRFAISMVKDVTERKRVDDQLRYEATHDALSGLPNRAFFQERLRTTFFSDAGFGVGVGAVLFVDLDEFKFVNGQSRPRHGRSRPRRRGRTFARDDTSGRLYRALRRRRVRRALTGPRVEG